VAQFSGSPRSGRAPLSVRFTDRSTGDVAAWAWDFGDGAGSSETSPTHLYVEPGTYTVSLAVSGPSGSDSEVKSAYITVSEPPPPPPDCDSGIDLVVTLLEGGELVRVSWCTGNDVINAGGRYWTLQAQTGGVCGWATLFQAEERTFTDVFGNGLGSDFCLRVVVTAEEPQEPDCIPGIIASDRDGPGC
jgi:PKD repeat protein